MEFKLNVNGEEHRVDVEPETPLLWVLRDEVGLKGTKFGCGIASCGACTVHLNGSPVRTCVLPVSSAVDASITTIEGLATEDGELHPVQAAWLKHQVPQCGYCQSGVIMAVSALLAENPKPTDQEVEDAITNVCRCGSYQRMRDALDELRRA